MKKYAESVRHTGPDGGALKHDVTHRPFADLATADVLTMLEAAKQLTREAAHKLTGE
jgi:hypothetical protein